MADHPVHRLRVRRIGIDTYKEHVVYLREDSAVCRSEGFAAHTRVCVRLNGQAIVATLNVVRSDVLGVDEAGLSEIAWAKLGARSEDVVEIVHPEPVHSLRFVRAKVYGNRLLREGLREIIADIAQGLYSDVEISAFVTACAGALDVEETIALTHAMVDVGKRLSWRTRVVADKHSVGGLPGNRTTMIVVPIIAASGLTIPKTSSRAITSPAGTADVMETITNVDLELEAMRRVVEREGGCIVWGGAVHLSPADDVLVTVERALDVDAPAQMVASVLSKKAAAGSTHVVLDVPVGATAKVRSMTAASQLRDLLLTVARSLGIEARVLVTDGSQPIGRGIGPALEARDVLAVLQGHTSAPRDLRDKATQVAGALLELVGVAEAGEGQLRALALLESGAAWHKFQAICEAQGGFREPVVAPYSEPFVSDRAGRVVAIDNRRLAMVAKLAGAPHARGAGVEFLAPIGTVVEPGQPLYRVFAEAPGELAYARAFAEANRDMVTLDPI